MNALKRGEEKLLSWAVNPRLLRFELYIFSEVQILLLYDNRSVSFSHRSSFFLCRRQFSLFRIFFFLSSFSLALLRPSSQKTFEGSRDEAGLVQYLKRLSGPASKLQKDKATVTEITQRETSIIAVFPGGEKSPEYKTYSAAADDLRSEVDLYHVTDASLLGDHCKKDCKNAKIFVFKTFDEPVMSVELKGMSKAQIKEFLDKATRPVVLELENIPRFRKYTSKVYDDKVRSKVRPLALTICTDRRDFFQEFLEISVTNVSLVPSSPTAHACVRFPLCLFYNVVR